MNNKQLVSLFFGLGFLVLIAGIFSTTTNMVPNNNQNLEPQTINRTTNNIGNSINQNNMLPVSNESSEKIKTELSKIDGVTNVEASVANKCALVSCTVSEELRNQPNFKNNLSNKIKEIDSNITMVYVMENQDMMNMDIDDVKTKFKTLDTTSFQNFWNNLTNDSQNMMNKK